MNDFTSSDWTSTKDLIYLVDRNLDLIRTNDAWRQFAAQNNGEALLKNRRRINVLESISVGQRRRWQALYNLLMSGQLPTYRETLSCPSPGLQRQHELTIRALYSPSGEIHCLQHRTRLLFAKPGVTEPATIIAAAERSESTNNLKKHPIELSAFSRPLEGVGGDLVWTYYETDTRAWLLIADAMGHNAPATQAVKRLGELIAEHLGDSPRAVIETVNREFFQTYQSEETGMFVTGLLLLIDVELEQVRVCNFGHHGLLTANSGLVKVEAGMPVGMLSEAGPWPEEILDTGTIGYRGMVFTDGVTEQFNPQLEMYCTERLTKAFQDTLDLPLPQSLERVLQSIDEFRDGAAQKDDQTLLGFELARSEP